MTTMTNRWRWIIGALLILLLLGFLWYLRNLVIYIVISGVLSLIAAPAVKRMEGLQIGKFRLPRELAAFVGLIIIWAVVFGLFSIVVPLAAAEIRVLSSLDYTAIWKGIEQVLDNVDALMADVVVVAGDGESSAQMIKHKMQSMFSVSDLTGIFGLVFSGLGNVVVAFFSISFMTFFFLREPGLFQRIIMVFVPKPIEGQMMNVFHASKELLSRYFIGITIQILLITTLITIGLLILGVKNALVIGLFAGFINVIPYIGPFIGAAVGMIVAVTTGLQTGMDLELVFLMFKVGGVFLAVQLLDNILFQPIIFSNSVKAHPLEIFIVISIGGTLGGIPFMILAIPGYTVLRIIAREFLSEFKVVQELTNRM